MISDVLKKKMSLQQMLKSGIIVGICWYVLMASVQYFYQRPLWNDEECILSNIIELPDGKMFSRPLVREQTFPRFYLYAIQQFSSQFQYHVLSLRLLPFLAMMAAFVLWVYIACRELSRPLDQFVFVLSWAASALLIYYSSELKQYSLDVLVAAWFFFFLYHQRQGTFESSRGMRICLVLSPLWGIVSYMAYVVMVFPLYNMFRDWKRSRTVRRVFWGYLLCMVSAVAIMYFFDVRQGSIARSAAAAGDYFVSVQNIGEFFRTAWEGTDNLFARWFAEHPKVVRKIARFFVVFGLIRMFSGFLPSLKREQYHLWMVDTLAGVIFFELLVLGVMRSYPFTIPRTALFFCPIVFLLTIKGIGDLRRIHPALWSGVYGAYIVFLLVVACAIGKIIIAGGFNFHPVLW